MNRCEWASCTGTDTELVDGWFMCAPHRRDHYAFERLEAEESRARASRSRDDIDPVAVGRACEGQPPAHLTVGERREAVRRLHGRRLNDKQIARRIGLTNRTVLRIRQDLGLPAIQIDDYLRSAS